MKLFLYLIKRILSFQCKLLLSLILQRRSQLLFETEAFFRIIAKRHDREFPRIERFVNFNRVQSGYRVLSSLDQVVRLTRGLTGGRILRQRRVLTRQVILRLLRLRRGRVRRSLPLPQVSTLALRFQVLLHCGLLPTLCIEVHVCLQFLVHDRFASRDIFARMSI